MSAISQHFESLYAACDLDGDGPDDEDKVRALREAAEDLGFQVLADTEKGCLVLCRMPADAEPGGLRRAATEGVSVQIAYPDADTGAFREFFAEMADIRANGRGAVRDSAWQAAFKRFCRQAADRPVGVADIWFCSRFGVWSRDAAIALLPEEVDPTCQKWGERFAGHFGSHPSDEFDRLWNSLESVCDVETARRLLEAGRGLMSDRCRETLERLTAAS